jgi:hypothetical protein
MVLYIYLVLGPEYYHLTLHEVDLHEDDGVDYSPAFYEVDEDVDEPEQVDVCKLERAVEVAVCELERAVETDAYGQERAVELNVCERERAVEVDVCEQERAVEVAVCEQERAVETDAYK